MKMVANLMKETGSNKRRRFTEESEGLYSKEATLSKTILNNPFQPTKKSQVSSQNMDFDKDDENDEDNEDEDGGPFQQGNDDNSEIGQY